MATTLQKTAPQRTTTTQQTPRKDRRMLWVGLVGVAAALILAGIAVGVVNLVAQTPKTEIFSPERVRALNYQFNERMHHFSPEAVRARNFRATQPELFSPEHIRARNFRGTQPELFSPERIRALNYRGSGSQSQPEELFSPERIRALN
jgi:hypothetical protein